MCISWEESLAVPCLPEMVFGHSGLELKHLESGLVLRFNVRDALREWKHDEPALKVAYSQQWTSQRYLFNGVSCRFQEKS